MSTSYARFLLNEEKLRAGWSVGRAQVAVARFRMVEGRDPTGFDELVPKYLDAAQQDRFAGKPLSWKTDSSGKPLIYSIGPDEVDDGGVALDDDDQGDIRWLMSVDDLEQADE